MKKKLSTRIFSVLLSLLMVVSILPAEAITASAGTNHSQQEAVNWVRNRVGTKVGGGQCVDLTKAYYEYLVGYSVRGNGCDYAHNSLPSGWTRIPYYYGFVAQPGDIAVWSWNKWAKNYGHVAIVTNADSTSMSFCDQGATYGYKVHSGSVKYKDGNWNFYGVIRPDFSNVIIDDGRKDSPQNDSHYNQGAVFGNGTYKNTCGYGVNMRSSVGASSSNNKIGCTVPNGAEVYVYETNGNWGKITFANKVGWVCLDYFTKVSIPVPASPSISYISSGNIPVGKSVTVNWNSVSGADNYTIGIRSTHINQDINVGSSTSYTYTLSNAEKYDFYVKASNVSGSSNWSSSRSCTAHNPVTVSFVDWDNTVLGSQIIEYGASATAPTAPQRKGYTFQGWNDSFYNVTANKTIKATYKINTYTVNFFDREGVLIESHKVTYGSDAAPPTDTHENSKYKFAGWNSTDYIDVYTDRADKNINIDGVYTWYNYNLPTVCTIKSATRQYDGYYVTFDIENNDSMPATGRAVVALKTAEGKLVDMTESTAFSIPAGKIKSGVEVFIPCTRIASSVEVFMVSDYSSGVPISPSVTSTISQGLMYAESTIMPDNSDGTLDIQSVLQYRYRDKEKSTGNTKVKNDWIWDGTKNTIYQNETGYQDSVLSTYDNETGKRVLDASRQVATYGSRTKYEYFHYRNYNKGSNHVLCPVDHGGASYHSFQTYTPMGCNGNSTCNGSPRYGSHACPNGCADKAVNNVCWWQKSWAESYQNGTKTQYNYKTYQYTYNFYRWKTWSDWSDTEVKATDNRDVETRTVYRYKSNNIQPEDITGKTRTINGKLDSSFAGKQITLYVYGYTGASDYTNQYIGQSVAASDGSYSFTFKLREEPTIETGDFIVAIGIEGTTNTTVIDIIEAPKPTYEVKFYDWDGTVINTQTVVEGESAVLPENPEKEGYDFSGWDKSVSNIRENTEFFADFERKQYTVVFVDWDNQQIEIKKFNHGDVLVAPEADMVEGYTFTGWDTNDVIVTRDMVVTAQYEANEYTIKFYDWNNNVIDTQNVKHGGTAVVPDDPEENGVNFANWFNPEDYQYVEHDAEIYPSYYFDETTDTPAANYQTGEYDNKILLELSSDDENAVIFYYLNDDETTEQIYSEPITIDRTCSVTYYATSFCKNDSEQITQYFCINTGDKPTEWMPYSEIPADVKNNLSDYVLESEKGYKYKDVQKTSDPDKIEQLEDAGWTREKVSYTSYTDWQDEKITIDESLIGFEVDTQEVEDTTVKWYQYSHYKYTDANGDVRYSPTTVDGYNCEYETVTLENRLSIAGFTDDNISYYNYENQKWFTQTRVNGLKTQYRSRYQTAEYYKWTGWSIDAPSYNDNREYQTDDVYRYYNKNYHIVYIDIYGNILLVEEGKTIDASQLDNVEGYDFKGLYTDEKLKNKFDISTPITESITLFSEYTPKKYTVIFQMQDGTELDTQKVEYMQSADAPDTDVVPGYVFGGWDKEFDCIAEDTVITGKYFKESEYARILLDKAIMNVYQGNSVSLTATITPGNLADEKIEWTSSNPDVAIVDDTGRVTAISQGTAIITAKVVKTKETAACTINVSPDSSNFIVLKSDSSLNYDSLGYLRRIAFETSVESASKEFTNDSLKYFNISGTELKSSDYIGTGTKIKLFNGSSAVDTRTVVVTGDMTGDGIINNRDVAMINKKLIDKADAQECQMLAIDVNGDGYVNNKDAAMIARYLVGKDAF